MTAARAAPRPGLVLVTGASGFVGRPLVVALAGAGYVIRAASRRPQAAAFPSGVEWVRLPDLAGEVDWRPLLAGVSDVVHLASATHDEPGMGVEVYDRVTRGALVGLAEAAKAAGLRRLVLISSIRAQTGISSDAVVTEATPAQPTDPYGRSKLEAEAALRASGAPHVILRFVRIYGPGVKGHIATLMRLARSPWPLPFSSFRSRRSLLALENAISAVRFALDETAVAGETYVVADPDPLALPEIMAVLRAAIGRRPAVFPLPAPLLETLLRLSGRADLWQPLTQSLIVSPAKLLAAGWRPALDARTGLAALMRAEQDRPVGT